MDFLLRAGGMPKRLGILPGTFNPVTVAHIALAEAALDCVDEMLFVLPSTLPHKEFRDASFLERLGMLRAVLAGRPRCSLAVAEHGLFADIAAECRAAYAPDLPLSFVCGRDAAERVASWEYGRPGAFASMLREFDFLVAARAGEYRPPPEFRAAMRRLPMAGDFEAVSATEVRTRIARGEPWEHLVPEAIHSQVRKIYLPPSPKE